MNFFYPQYRILSNYRIANYEYDIILESTEQPQLDFIFEIKYYPTGYRKNSFKEAITHLSKSTEAYIDVTRRKAKPLLLIVMQKNEEINLDELSDINEIRKLREFKNAMMTIVSFDELETITKDRIEKVMDMTLK
ncbi:MAG: hypothetical protein A2W90_05680 [Bacteroidetes bacterium GWF2_42_66]|nr:MAG: hypothetical protein A2W92_01065 [Bacteroidetes bacterium GWA2_42_15]OFY03536.1 MAG: hypothetical protein A2W89_18405 [Bacteroidetes bacterium GWE2_42_39]OFY45901.1 MAG: hypothetical protein A2W90_05680 [Bacteroidetes bacterium GWF2_42_66]HBL75143.1 hypothetical protein [Prolixibacteraceae bacterium]HCR91617.1 hypothetical protein [Prolixibacteraceae bacterium]